MRWPFARHSHFPAAPVGDAGSVRTVEPAGADTPSRGADESVAPSRRDWAALPPLQVAGGRPIYLTAAAQDFTESLAARQVLVRSPRLEHVRPIDAPSGSFRGVLAATTADHDGGSAPELQEPSPLPAVAHRQLSAVTAEDGHRHGLSPIEQLLAIGEPGAGGLTPSPPTDVSGAPRVETYEEPGDGEAPPRGRRAGLADSRRRGLGPAYHGPLPEAMRAERTRGDDDEGFTTETVPSDVRATMRDLLGLDVGDRLVHRGPGVSAEARAMGAQAFTRDGQVHIADEVGPLDQATGRAALAHELTHAAQQIVRGTLPDEGSPAGRAMEAHAQRVEQFVRGDAGAGKPSPELLHALPATTDPGDTDVAASTRQMMRELVDTGLARFDGSDGIVFTRPPSTMTAAAGTQRQATTAPAAHAASQDHWNPLATLGNTLSQGLANDMLGFMGSSFGFSDELMGEQRHELVAADRKFRRDQTTNAYKELRMEHLRQVELASRSHMESGSDVAHSTSLDDHALQVIDARVQHEITQRLTLLDTQSAQVLETLNRTRAEHHETALLDVPDENFNVALTALFDDPVADEPQTADALLAILTPASTPGGHGGATRPGGGTSTTPAPSTGPAGAGTATGTPPATTAPGHSTGTTPGSSSPSGSHTTGGSGAAGDEQPDEPWRTGPTVGSRFRALGGGIANAEIDFFASSFGFSDDFTKELHAEATPHAAAPATAAAPAADTHGAATDHHDAAAGAHGAAPDAHGAVAGAHGAAPDAHGAAAGAHTSPAAHEAVDHIVGDPYALDELANRLYPNIRTRLRQELLIDRERAGLLADFH